MKFELELTQRLQKSLKGYDFEVGVLKDGPHKEPVHTLPGEPHGIEKLRRRPSTESLKCSKRIVHW